MECVPCCPTDGCYLGANLWSTGWLDNNHPHQRPEDKWLGVECWQSLVVCWVRKGQGKLMRSIRCTQIPFILVAISQSHHLPLSVLYSADPLVDPKTHIGTDTVVLFLCHDSHNPLCLWIYVLCLDSFFVMITSYHTFLSQSWWFCLLSAPLWSTTYTLSIVIYF